MCGTSVNATKLTTSFFYAQHVGCICWHALCAERKGNLRNAAKAETRTSSVSKDIIHLRQNHSNQLNVFEGLSDFGAE
jgi:hypothetical protein